LRLFLGTGLLNWSPRVGQALYGPAKSGPRGSATSDRVASAIPSGNGRQDMKRIQMVGLSLTAALVASAMISSVAYGGEYGQCLKAPKVSGKYTGKYLDRGCEQGASQAQIEAGKLNKYTWQEVAQADKPFTDKSGKVALKAGEREVVCTRSKSTGEISGWQKNVEHVTLEGCSSVSPRAKCSSSGQPVNSGNVALSTLTTYLIDHGQEGPTGREPKEGEVWNEFEGSPPFLAEFECGSVSFRLNGPVLVGSASGVFAPVGTMRTTGSLAFGSTNGEQGILLEDSQDGGTEWHSASAILETVVKVKFKSKIEVRPCNQKGAVSEGKGLPTCQNEEKPPWIPEG
jgi:hypothetical protein